MKSGFIKAAPYQGDALRLRRKGRQIVLWVKMIVLGIIPNETDPLGVQIRQFRHLYARQHVYDGYGSQTYLRRCSGLDPASVTAIVTDRQGSA